MSSGRAAVGDRLSLATPPLWQRWMAAEDAHFAVDRTRAHADVIVDGE
ncbi:hypothetical protein [Nocardia thraciensis]